VLDSYIPYAPQLMHMKVELRVHLFMCYTLYMYITMATTTKLCMPITECGMGKGMYTAHDNVL